MSGGHAADPRLRGPSRPVAPVGALKPRLVKFVGCACPYCGVEMTASGEQHVTRDHVLSRMRMDNLERALRSRLQVINVIVVCFDCNGRKGSMTLFRFMGRVGGENSPMGQRIMLVMDRFRAQLPAADFLALTGAPR